MESAGHKRQELIGHEYIIKKLYDTCAAFEELFPELTLIRQELLSLPVMHLKQANGAQKLLAIGEVLKSYAVTFYIVRHLYHHFKEEVEAIQNGSDPDKERKYYIHIPE